MVTHTHLDNSSIHAYMRCWRKYADKLTSVFSMRKLYVQHALAISLRGRSSANSWRHHLCVRTAFLLFSLLALVSSIAPSLMIWLLLLLTAAVALLVVVVGQPPQKHTEQATEEHHSTQHLENTPPRQQQRQAKTHLVRVSTRSPCPPPSPYAKSHYVPWGGVR